MMENELIDPSANDPASKAFDRLRREVTTMRLAVEHLADAPGKIEIPDYTETLEKLARATQANATHIESMSDRPGLQLTPESLSNAIIKAGVTSRASDHAALASATTAFQNAHQTLTKSLVSARTANEQDKRLKKVSINCLIAGMIAGAIFPALISNALPASWHVPEKVAASSLNLDMWSVGEHLLTVADPKRQETWSAFDATTAKTSESARACLKTKAKSKRMA